MDGYGQFCPVAVASEIFTRRWTPLVLRELLAGSTHFNEIRRGLPRISRTTLATRLRELERAGVLCCAAGGVAGQSTYRLTAAGREFAAVIDALGAWGQRWTQRINAANLDPSLLMWNLRRRIELQRLPARRVVVQFEFENVPARASRDRSFWLILEPPEVDLCIRDPGYDTDLTVRADLRAFTEVWLGELHWIDALRRGSVRIAGPRGLARDFPGWLQLSRFAAVPRH